jgi:hypothetical protein
MEAVLEEEKEHIKKYGWFFHVFLPEVQNQNYLDCHTHGLDLIGHLDFQLVLPIDSGVLYSLATTLVERVQGGERFSSGMRVDKVVKDYDVLLIEKGLLCRGPRRVLRVILPDQAGNLEKDKLTGIFAAQYQELPE